MSSRWAIRSEDSLVTVISISKVDGVVVNGVVVSLFDTRTSFCEKSQYELFRKHNWMTSEGVNVTRYCDSFVSGICDFSVFRGTELVVVVVVVRIVDEVMVSAEEIAVVSTSNTEMLGVVNSSLSLFVVVIRTLGSLFGEL